jgi:hypothetical protein
MRTTIIPAQITTVEDKIAGSLSMSQIFLLISPVLWATLVYTLFIPQMRLSTYKMPLILIATVICLVLAIRIKEKIVLEWIAVIFRYKSRPKYYLFNKNSLVERQIDLPKVLSSEIVAKKTKQENKDINEVKLTVADLIKLESIMSSGKLAVNFNFKEKRI